MAQTNAEWIVGDCEIETPYLFAPDDQDELDPELQDGANPIWPCGDFLEDALPPAPGRCRRVPHDW